MTKKERVIRALNHQETDFTPYQVDFTHQAWEKAAAYFHDRDFAAKIGNHIGGAYYSGHSNMEVAPEHFRDDFGVVWNRSGVDKDIGVIDNYVIPEPVMNYRFPEVPAARLRAEYERAMANRNDQFQVAQIGFSLFERAWSLCGMENLLEYMVTDPEFVDELLDAIVDYNLKILSIYAEYDFDMLFFGDDWGMQKGQIMGPVYWRKFIKPHLAKLYSFAKERGKFVGQHSCGDIQALFPDVIELGLNVYQTFQPEIYNMAEVKEKFGGKLSFWGGISTQRMLPFETPEGVKRITRETIRLMGAGGGYILSPTHSIPGDVPAENIAALIEAVQNQKG